MVHHTTGHWYKREKTLYKIRAQRTFGNELSFILPVYPYGEINSFLYSPKNILRWLLKIKLIYFFKVLYKTNLHFLKMIYKTKQQLLECPLLFNMCLFLVDNAFSYAFLYCTFLFFLSPTITCIFHFLFQLSTYWYLVLWHTLLECILKKIL